MGSHLLAENGNVKTETAFGKKVWMNNFFQNLHLEKFNSITKLFVPGADLVSML